MQQDMEEASSFRRELYLELLLNIHQDKPPNLSKTKPESPFILIETTLAHLLISNAQYCTDILSSISS